MSEDRFRSIVGVLLLGFLFLLSLFLFRAAGNTDVLIWQKWMAIVHDEGLVQGYATIVANFPKIIVEAPAWVNGGGEYPPLAYAILYSIRVTGDRLGLPPQLAIKLTLLVFHWATVLLVLVASRRLFLSAAFSAAVMLGSVALGYLDILFAPALIGAYWALAGRRHLLAVAFFLLSSMIKWQSLVLLPFVAIYLFDVTSIVAVKATIRQPLFRQAFALGAVTVLVLAVLFGSTPALALFYAMNHTFLSGLAMNLPWLEGYGLKVLFHPTFTAWTEMTAPIPPRLVMLAAKLQFWVAFIITFIWALRSERTLRNCLLFSILGTMTYCTLNTGVHENHWFLPLFVAFSLLLHERTETNKLICLLLAVMANVNVFFFYGLTGEPIQPPVLGMDLSIPFAILCVTVWLAFALYVRKAAQRDLRPQGAKTFAAEPPAVAGLRQGSTAASLSRTPQDATEPGNDRCQLDSQSPVAALRAEGVHGPRTAHG